MRAVGVKALKNKLSEYLRLVAAGETVLVTDRDRVVAELRPPGPERSMMFTDVQLADLVRNGVLIPPLVAPGSGQPPRQPVGKTRELLEELRRDREER